MTETEEEAMKEWGLEEALYNQRAIRDFTDEPVSDEDIHYLLDTAVKAPNGGNRQPWIFLVIRDEDARAMLGEWYLQSYEAYTERVRAMAARGVPESKADTDRWDKIGAFSRFQLEFQRAPIMILVCADERLTSKVHPPDALPSRSHERRGRARASARGPGVGERRHRRARAAGRRLPR